MQGARGRQRRDEIVLQAAGLATSERPAFFAELADTEPDLIAEAQRILSAAVALPSSFLAVPAADLLETITPFAGEDETLAIEAPAAPLTRRSRSDCHRRVVAVERDRRRAALSGDGDRRRQA